jgi:hypothetical protein
MYAPTMTRSIEVTIGRETRLYHAFITTAPTTVDAPATVTRSTPLRFRTCAAWLRTRSFSTPPAQLRAGPGGAPAPVYTEATCKVPKSEHSFPSVEKVGTRRQPGGGAAFGPVSLNWFVSQSDTPLAPTRGQLVDHIAVSVPTLDSWIAKLKAENVTFLQQPYKFGDIRAIMIEGPSRESIEIIGK